MLKRGHDRTAPHTSDLVEYQTQESGVGWLRAVLRDAIGPGYPVHPYSIDPHSGG